MDLLAYPKYAALHPESNGLAGRKNPAPSGWLKKGFGMAGKVKSRFAVENRFCTFWVSCCFGCNRVSLFCITIDIGLWHKSLIFRKNFSFSPQKKRKCNKSVTTVCYNNFDIQEIMVFLVVLTNMKLKSGQKNYTFQSNIKNTISSGYAV